MKAIDYFNQVLQINPKDMNALYYKGVAYDNIKEYQKAIDCYDQALQIDPKDTDT